MSNSFEAARDLLIKRLLEKADEHEKTGHQQFTRSANHDGIGYTTFSNARSWGNKAAGFRQAAYYLRTINS